MSKKNSLDDFFASEEPAKLIDKEIKKSLESGFGLVFSDEEEYPNLLLRIFKNGDLESISVNQKTGETILVESLGNRMDLLAKHWGL